MDEPLTLLGRLGREPVAGKLLEQPRGELDRVHHLPLRRPRMDAMAADADTHLGCGERLVVDPPDLGAVQRVGEVRSECVDVEVLDAAADLLVHGEADADRRVLDLRVADEIGDRGHDLGHARLVVGAEEGRPVRRDDVVADPVG
jgi:hypothetical protein